MNVPTKCQYFDETKFECIQCMAGNYISYFDNNHRNQVCCANGQFYNLETYKCEAISSIKDHTDTDPLYDAKCDQIKFDLQKCVKCEAGYVLHYEDQKCVSVPTNCQEFDPIREICLECNTSTYLSNGLCCAEGKYNRNGTC